MKTFLIAFCLTLTLAIGAPVFASENPFLSQSVTESDDLSVYNANTHPIEIAEVIIKTALSLLGIGTTALMLYAGVRWMTAGGNEEAVTTAKKTLRNSVIGLILIMMSYALTLWVTRTIQRYSASYGVGNSTDFSIGGAAEYSQQRFDDLRNSQPYD